jgi:adenylate cyclase
MDRALSKNDSRQLVLAHFALGNNSFNMGKLLSAKEHLEAVLSLYDPKRDGPSAVRHSVDAKANVLSYLAITLWDLGYPDQALKRAYEAVAFAQALPHMHSLASAQCILGIAQHFRREASAAQETAERLVAFCAEHGFTLWAAFGTYQRGWALSAQGHYEDGIAQMKEGIAGHRATGARIGHPYFLCTLAKACLQAGRLDEAQNILSEALALAEEQEGREHEAEIYRVKGELLLKQNDSIAAEADNCFGRAIETAQSQSAKSHQLRATMSLVRLLAKQEARDEARAMLADIYNWFTEGFDTADLKDAKALLDQLGA